MAPASASTPGISPARLAERIRADALAHGFDAVGIAPAEAAPETATRLRQYLDAGRHGTMDWMAETAARRGAPRALWPQARSVIMLGMNYGPGGDPLAITRRPALGAISVYARARDYHELIKGRLKQIAGRFVARSGAGVKVFVDPKSMIFLQGSKLHFVTGLMESGFKFINPNAGKGCGCGESFSPA